MKSNVLNSGAIFLAGAGVGSLIMYKFLKKKYDSLINEEIESVKKSFSQSNKPIGAESTDNKDIEEKSEETPLPSDTELETLEDVLEHNGYNNSSDIKINERGRRMNEPYIITPDEFGDRDYATITLWYYTDEVVTNDAGQVISNVENLIGTEFSDHLGEFDEDPDTVYVRNDDHEIDYQVLMEYRAYSTL